MNFDPSTAKEIGFEYSFDPSTAQPVAEFDASTATPVHDWGTTDARDAGVTNVGGMGVPERRGTSWERIKASGAEAFMTNPTHGRPTQGIEKLKTAQNMLKDLERDPFKTTTHLPHVQQLQKEGTEELQKYLLMRKGMESDLQNLNPALWERILGGAAGSLTDPINLLGVGNSSTLFKTLFKQFSVGAGLGVLSAIEQGNFDKAVGMMKDDPTIRDLLDAGLTTGTIAAVLSGIFHVAAKPGVKVGKSGVDVKVGEAFDKIKSREGPVGPQDFEGPIRPENRDVDTSGMRADQYLGRHSKSKLAEIERDNELRARHGDPEVAGNREMSFEDKRGAAQQPYWPDADLEAAKKTANRRANSIENLPESVDLMTGIPDVRDGDIRSPYMTQEETARAQRNYDKNNQDASHSEMAIPEEMGNQPYWPDADLEAAKAKANRGAPFRNQDPVDRSVAPEFKEVSESAINVFNPKAVALVKEAEGKYKSKVKLIEMPIEQFLDLAEDGIDPVKTEEVKKYKVFSDLPFISIEKTKDGQQQVYGHEGRHRARELLRRGYKTMPVEVRADIRWDQQSNPKNFDYLKDWPTELRKQPPKEGSVPFPVNRIDKLSDAFLKAASKKQAGVLDLTAFTGPGYRDLVEIIDTATTKFWSSVEDSFKPKYKDAYWSRPDGTPSLLFHATHVLDKTATDAKNERPFTRYDPSFTDGRLVHVGTIDSAEIKKNYFVNSGASWKTIDRGDVRIAPLVEKLDSAGLQGADPFSDSPAIKKVREAWYDELNTALEQGLKRDLDLYGKSTTKLQDEIKKRGTKAFYEKYVVNKGTSLHFDELAEGMNHSTSTVRDIIRDIRNDYPASEFTDRLMAYIRAKGQASLANKWQTGKNTHVRPLISNAKSPLFVKDFGNWGSPTQIIDHLVSMPDFYPDGTRAPTHNKARMSPLHPRDILGPEKFQQFKNDLLDVKDMIAKQPISDQMLRDAENFSLLYNTLERYGFDHFASENQFERARASVANKLPEQDLRDTPNISLAFWNPDLLTDIVDVPRKTNKQPFAPRSQRGAIEVREIAQGVTEQYKNAKDLLEAYKDKLTDIPFLKKWVPITANQAGEWFKNPIVEWTYNHLRRIDNDIDIRANTNKQKLGDTIDFFKSDQLGALKMIHALVKMQDPGLKAARQAAEDGGIREQFLADHGVAPEHIKHAIKILDVMKETGAQDQRMALYGRGHNFHMEPMYFPKEHTGPFTLYVMDSEGNVLHAQPFDHITGARHFEKAWKEKVKDTTYSVEVVRNGAGVMGNIYAMLGEAGDKLPPFLRDINADLLKEIEVRKRKFEMERSSENITGATGEILHTSDTGMWAPAENTRILSLVQRRLEQSYSLEKAMRIIKEIQEPLLDDRSVLVDKNGKQLEQLQRYLDQLVAREHGLDISMFQQAQRATVDKLVDSAGKQIDLYVGKARDYKGGDISYFKPNEMARAIQAYTWFMSVMKLGWSIPVLTANASTMLITPVDGFRTAAREGLSQTVTIGAMQKSMLAPFDPEVKAWLHQADLEGMVEARISDPMTFVQTHTRTKLDKSINYARDAIETQTNKAALTFYYNFYKLAYPNLNPLSDAFKTKVYKAARSWTGDYTMSAQVMQLSQLGYLGQLHSNFAKWKYNQIGRLVNDIQMLGEGNAIPFLMTMGIGVMLSGAMGAAVAVEYEAIRRALFSLSGGAIDWKPFTEFMFDSREWVRKEMGDNIAKIVEVFERGPVTHGSLALSEHLGLGTAPDLSQNLRYSSLADVSIIPFSFAGDMYKGISTTIKGLWGAAARGENVTQQELKDLTKMLPSAVAKPAMEIVTNKIQHGDYFKPGYMKQFGTQDKGKYRRTPAEKAMAFAGFTSYNENEFAARVTGKEWNDRRVKTMIGKQIDRMTTNLDNPKVLQDAALKIYEERGIEGVEAAIQGILKQKEEVHMSYLELELKKALNISDPIARAKVLEALKKFLPAK